MYSASFALEGPRASTCCFAPHWQQQAIDDNIGGRHIQVGAALTGPRTECHRQMLPARTSTEPIRIAFSREFACGLCSANPERSQIHADVTASRLNAASSPGRRIVVAPRNILCT